MHGGPWATPQASNLSLHSFVDDLRVFFPGVIYRIRSCADMPVACTIRHSGVVQMLFTLPLWMIACFHRTRFWFWVFEVDLARSAQDFRMNQSHIHRIWEKKHMCICEYIYIYLLNTYKYNILHLNYIICLCNRCLTIVANIDMEAYRQAFSLEAMAVRASFRESPWHPQSSITSPPAQRRGRSPSREFDITLDSEPCPTERLTRCLTLRSCSEPLLHGDSAPTPRRKMPVPEPVQSPKRETHNSLEVRKWGGTEINWVQNKMGKEAKEPKVPRAKSSVQTPQRTPFGTTSKASQAKNTDHTVAMPSHPSTPTCRGKFIQWLGHQVTPVLTGVRPAIRSMSNPCIKGMSVPSDKKKSEPAYSYARKHCRRQNSTPASAVQASKPAKNCPKPIKPNADGLSKRLNAEMLRAENEALREELARANEAPWCHKRTQCGLTKSTKESKWHDWSVLEKGKHEHKLSMNPEVFFLTHSQVVASHARSKFGSGIAAARARIGSRWPQWSSGGCWSPSEGEMATASSIVAS